jgi:dienelactone hydrolase
MPGRGFASGAQLITTVHQISLYTLLMFTIFFDPRRERSGRIRVLLATLLISTAPDVDAQVAADQAITIHSDGWALRGDLGLPESSPARAFAILLHKAAGDRSAYAQMAETLANSGIASLRIDLRGHGESTNIGAFDPDIGRFFDRDDPAVVANFDLIRAGDRDIVAVLRWLADHPDYDDLPLIMMGSSYTGEEMAEAGAEFGYADVYVALAPGNFSEGSILAIDGSGAPWLFVRAEVELPFFPALFEAIRDGSESAEIWVLPGEGHATDLFDENPKLHLQLLEWIDARLPR